MTSQLQPPDPPPLPPLRVEQRKRQVLGALRPGSPRRRRKHYLLVAVGVLLALPAGAVVASARMGDPPSRVTLPAAGVGCFAEPSLESDAAIVRLHGKDPVAACRSVWESGALDPSWPENILRFIRRDGSAPSLVACIYPSGALAVIPGDDAGACAEAGMREASAADVDLVRRIDSFSQAIIDRYFRAACPDPDVIGPGIEQAIREYGLTGWRVARSHELPPDARSFGRGRFDKEHPCAMLDVDAGRKLVVLVPSVPPLGTDW